MPEIAIQSASFDASSPEAAAWAAGLFEGEGCFYEVRSQSFPHLSMTLEMKDQDVVERFAAVIAAHGVRTRSRITTRWRGNEKHARQYALKMSGVPAEASYALLRPYLCERRTATADAIIARRREAVEAASIVRTCIGCGVEFSVPLKGRDKVWCSSNCYHRVQSRTSQGRALANERNRRYKQRLKLKLRNVSVPQQSIPALSRGVGGTIHGTNPLAVLMAKQPREH